MGTAKGCVSVPACTSKYVAATHPVELAAPSYPCEN